MSELSLSERLIGTMWVCTNCIMVVANGDDSGRGENDPEPLTKLDRFEITAGGGIEIHDAAYCLKGKISELNEESPEIEWPDVPGDYECDCETISFMWSECDGCEDGLGGERHAVTVWAPQGATVNPNYKIGGHYWLDRNGNPL